MLKWIHKLLNPHCPHCIEEIELSNHCETCEVLKLELSHLRSERDILLNRLLNNNEQPNQGQEESNFKDMQLLRPGHIPWRVRQQALEREDRSKARILEEQKRELSNMSKGDMEKTIEKGVS